MEDKQRMGRKRANYRNLSAYRRQEEDYRDLKTLGWSFGEDADVTESNPHDFMSKRERKSTGAEVRMEHLRPMDVRSNRRSTWQPFQVRENNRKLRESIQTKKEVTGRPGKGEFRYINNGVEVRGQRLKGLPPKQGKQPLHPRPVPLRDGMNRKERNKLKMAKRHGYEYEPVHKEFKNPRTSEGTVVIEDDKVFIYIEYDDLKVDGQLVLWDNLPKPSYIRHHKKGMGPMCEYTWDLKKVDQNRLMHALNGNISR